MYKGLVRDKNDKVISNSSCHDKVVRRNFNDGDWSVTGQLIHIDYSSRGYSMLNKILFEVRKDV